MIHYKVHLEYDGTNYVGWQAQKDSKKSIEEIAINAIYNLSQENVKINCAGRTDAGVHAINQVIDFFLEKKFSPHNIIMGLNHHFQDTDVVALSCDIVDENFHSRFSAINRSYRYVIINRKARLALDRYRAWHISKVLDIEMMRQSSRLLEGCHDFSSFRDSQCQSNSPIKTIDKIAIITDGEKIFIDIHAKSFLHHMVRNIVGTLMWVGIKKISVEDVQKILDLRDRSCSGPNAPACGLYFLGAIYS